MTGLIGTKIGMTSIFDDDGNNIPCTVVEVEPNVVTQIKEAEGKDGYNAVQLGYGEATEKNTSRHMIGHFRNAGVEPKQTVREFRNFRDLLEEDVTLGEPIRVDDIFFEGDIVNVVGVSKGKGFQGVVKRHNFSGVGGQTHGQHDRERHPGSIGAASDPSRVFPGMKMGGRMGNQRTKELGLQVVKILPDNNVILIKGGVPGPKNGLVEIYKTEDA